MLMRIERWGAGVNGSDVLFSFPFSFSFSFSFSFLSLRFLFPLCFSPFISSLWISLILN